MATSAPLSRVDDDSLSMVGVDPERMLRPGLLEVFLKGKNSPNLPNLFVCHSFVIYLSSFMLKKDFFSFVNFVTLVAKSSKLYPIY